MDDMGYDVLPTRDDIARMVTWVECPAHGQKVGLDTAGHVVGRCAECASEAALGTVELLAHALRADAA